MASSPLLCYDELPLHRECTRMLTPTLLKGNHRSATLRCTTNSQNNPLRAHRLVATSSWSVDSGFVTYSRLRDERRLDLDFARSSGGERGDLDVPRVGALASRRRSQYAVRHSPGVRSGAETTSKRRRRHG